MQSPSLNTLLITLATGRVLVRALETNPLVSAASTQYHIEEKIEWVTVYTTDCCKPSNSLSGNHPVVSSIPRDPEGSHYRIEGHHHDHRHGQRKSQSKAHSSAPHPVPDVVVPPITTIPPQAQPEAQAAPQTKVAPKSQPQPVVVPAPIENSAPPPPPPPAAVPAPVTTVAPEVQASPVDNAAAAPASTEDSELAKFRQDMLDHHNQVRALHGVAPLTWSDTLEAYAEEHTKACSSQHTFGQYGENLAWGFATAADAATAWYDEIKDYNPLDPGFSEATGHYSQVVWGSTKMLGCYSRDCAAQLGGRLVMCEYDPPGNIVGAAGAYFKANVLPLLGV